MKFFSVLFLSGFFCLSAQAQSSALWQSGYYKTAIRFNFTGLADPIDLNIAAGVEHALSPRLAVIVDVAYIPYSAYFPSPPHTRGYIFRPAIRYYSSIKHKEFFEVNFFYKHVNYHLKDWLNKDCVNGVPAYQEYKDFIYGKRVTGLNLLAGFQTDLSRNKALRFEGYFGLGVRVKNQNIIREGNACYDINQTLFHIQGKSGSSVSTNLPMGMRVIYCIRD